MNQFKKLYCRTYQTVFRAALPVLPYWKPKRLGSVTEVPELLAKKKIHAALLVTDPVVRGLGLTAPLEQALREKGIRCAVYDKTVANPTTDNVEAAKALYEAKGCGAIIAFGGGSSMDCGKAMGARIAKPRQPLGKMEGILKIHKRIPLLIAVPTTAGTGSETTLAAVITDGETRHKYAINDFVLIPRYAVLDPEVTRSLPPTITATTGMDALTHAVEAYIGRSTTKETRADALEAVRLIFENLEMVYADGNNMDARGKMLKASFLAGSAFTKSYVGYVHAIAHSLGGKYNIPHGLANAVLMPYVLEAYGPVVYKKLQTLAEAAGLDVEGKTREQAAKMFLTAVKDMNHRMGIPTTLPGIRREDIPQLARYAEHEANPLYPVPCLWDAEKLESFYFAVMEKKAGREIA